MKKMIKRSGRIGMAIAVFCTLCIAMTSCYIEPDDPWWGPAPSGWNTINDSRLRGYWGLVQSDGINIPSSAANYLFFNGSGRGYYYYWNHGQRYTERTVYYSQDSNTGVSNYQLNIQYEFSNPITVNYWFTNGGNTLWMQWRTYSGQVQTYVYDRWSGAPW